MPADQVGDAFQILIVAGFQLLREDDDLVVGKILQHAETKLVTKGMPAEISAALDQDGARSHLCCHGVAIVALSRTFVGERDAQFGYETRLAEPNRVLAT